MQRTLICPVCQKEFLTTDKRIQSCSKTCGAVLISRKVHKLNSPEKRRRLIELHEQGLSQKQISVIFGVHEATVWEAFSRIKKETDYKYKDIVPRKKGEGAGMWKGGITRDPKGYIKISTPGHPRGTKYGGSYVHEHILVMEKHLGRHLVYLGRGNLNNEVVHHINGIKTDNRLENLIMMLARHHSYLHINQRWATSITDTTNNIVYSSLTLAAEVAGVNEHTLATYIHFQWKLAGCLWAYSG